MASNQKVEENRPTLKFKCSPQYKDTLYNMTVTIIIKTRCTLLKLIAALSRYTPARR